MKICFVTTEFVSEETDFDGGLANYIYKIAKALISDGHQVLVLVQSNKSERFVFDNILVERVNVNLNNPILKFVQKLINRGESVEWVYSSYILNKRFKALNKIEKFDIVQYSSFRATALFRPRNITAIVRLSSFHPFWKGYLDGRMDNQTDKILAKLEQLAVKKATAVFGPSKVIADAIGKATNLHIPVIETLYDIPTITDSKLSDSYQELESKKYLLFIGKINGMKGGVVIANAIYSILNNHKDLYFVFAGRDAGCRNLIIENSKEYSSRLIFLDRVKKEDLYKIILKSYGVVLPSLMDNFPNACIEAMSLKRIVIGTDGASFEQLIKDGDNGFLIESGDSDSLVDKVNELLNLAEEDRLLMQEKAYKRIELLSPARVVKNTIDFYNTANNNTKNDPETNTRGQN